MSCPKGFTKTSATGRGFGQILGVAKAATNPPTDASYAVISANGDTYTYFGEDGFQEKTDANCTLCKKSAAPGPGSGGHWLVGYYCPGCPSAAGMTREKLIGSPYNVIILAFYTLDESGTLTWPTPPTPSPTPFGFNTGMTKDDVTALQNAGKTVLFSVGGALSDPVLATWITSAFIEKFAESASALCKTNGFDGMDFDLENRTGGDAAGYEAIGLAFREVARRVHAAGHKVCAAPQCTDFGSCTGTGTSFGPGSNELVPMFGIPSRDVTYQDVTFSSNALKQNPFWMVFPQMYNSWARVETTAAASAYWKAMTTKQSFPLSLAAGGPPGAPYTVGFDQSRLLLGFPSAKTAAGSGYLDPDDIVKDVLSSNKGMVGVMTWSIGWDNQNGWKFGNVMATYFGLPHSL